MDCNCEGYIGRVYRVISEAYPSTARSRIKSSFFFLVDWLDYSVSSSKIYTRCCGVNPSRNVDDSSLSCSPLPKASNDTQLSSLSLTLQLKCAPRCAVNPCNLYLQRITWKHTSMEGGVQLLHHSSRTGRGVPGDTALVLVSAPLLLFC